ncbi:MAG TPA: BrnT family toxin [Candidatus Saccharimonadales bacterium]|nr:BrnT family toxin [Candidatus Saccharimonadales bacterium]
MGSRRRGHSHQLPEFEWDENNEDKLLLRHNVSALEAEQCFANPHTRRRDGDDLLLLGVTDHGRMLFLVYEQKPDGVVRVYSAREMNDKERRTYRRHAR